MDAAKIREELARPFPEEVLQAVKKGGANLTYVPVAEVIARLNLVLGTENWGSDIDVWIAPEHPKSIVAKAKVWAVIDGVRTEKTGFGGEAIKFYKDGGPNEGIPLDLGDSYKGASSDAFKKACTQLGVGLDIARKEDALAAEQYDLERFEKDKAPVLTSEDITNIRARIDELSKEDRRDFAGWWADNVPYKLDSGKVTEAYLDDIAAQISTYTPA
jgi:hypothetical protein